MDRQTKMQVGSRSGDEFRFWHKTALPSRFYACDIDLVLIEKYPPRPAAVIDYKLRDGVTNYPDRVKFTEVILYNWFVEKGVPVFIVKSDEYLSSFDVYRYIGGDHRPFPPISDLDCVLEGATLADFRNWENDVRGLQAGG